MAAGRNLNSHLLALLGDLGCRAVPTLKAPMLVGLPSKTIIQHLSGRFCWDDPIQLLIFFLVTQCMKQTHVFMMTMLGIVGLDSFLELLYRICQEAPSHVRPLMIHAVRLAQRCLKFEATV